MCRLAAFPPGFSRDAAIEILTDFEKDNKDGTGSAYVQDGKFVISKWALPLNQVLSRKYGFLDHMPYDGWTIAHVRAASFGIPICKENSHPFVINNINGKPQAAVMHNGLWKDYDVVRMALKPFIHFESDTDSEVAANVIVRSGPMPFIKETLMGGVYLALNIDGTLWSIKTSGQLYFCELADKQMVLASEFDDDKYPNTLYANEGWCEFDKAGKVIEFHKREYYTPPTPRAITYNSVKSTGNVESAIRTELNFWATIL